MLIFRVVIQIACYNYNSANCVPMRLRHLTSAYHRSIFRVSLGYTWMVYKQAIQSQLYDTLCLFQRHFPVPISKPCGLNVCLRKLTFCKIRSEKQIVACLLLRFAEICTIEVVVRYGCFLKWWYPQIIHLNRVFHYKPSILGYPYIFLETPISATGFCQLHGICVFSTTRADFEEYFCWCCDDKKLRTASYTGAVGWKYYPPLVGTCQ